MNEDRIAALEAENAALKAALTAMAQRLADKAGWIKPEPVIQTPTRLDSVAKWSWLPDVQDNDREWVTL
jgi:hypothetical protein